MFFILTSANVLLQDKKALKIADADNSAFESVQNAIVVAMELISFHAQWKTKLILF